MTGMTDTTGTGSVCVGEGAGRWETDCIADKFRP